MNFTREDLQTKKIYELRSILAKMGAGSKRHEKAVDLVNRIMELSIITQPNERIEEVTQSKKTIEYPWLTTEEVLVEAKRYLNAGLTVSFDEEGKVWSIEVKRGPYTMSDSGTMKMPLIRFKRCCEKLCAPTVIAAEKGGSFTAGTPLTI